MKLGTVIGRVTLSVSVPALKGARWLMVSPCGRENYQQGLDAPASLSKEPSLVLYDDLGGGVGQTIGFVEGHEAALPFADPTPIDALNVALVDEMFYSPFTK
jgi:carbon dioxide concentrating mechanism protein CcmL